MAGFYGGTVVPTDYSRPTSFVDSITKHFDAMYRNFPNRPKRMSALEAAQTAQIMQNMRMQRDAEGGKPGDPGTIGGMMKSHGGRASQESGTDRTGGWNPKSGGSSSTGEDPRDVRAWNEKQADLNRAHDLEKIKAEAAAKRTGVYATPSGSSSLPSTSVGSGWTPSLPTPTPSPTYGDTDTGTGTLPGLPGYTPDLPRIDESGEWSASNPNAIAFGPQAGGLSDMGYQSPQMGPLDFGPNPYYRAAGDAGIPTPQYNDGSTPAGEFGETMPAASGYGGNSTPIANAAAPVGAGDTQPSTDVPQDVGYYAKGTKYIDEDQWAKLHEGEAVIPKQLNPAANPDQSFTPIGEIVAALPGEKEQSPFAPGITGPGGLWDTAKRGASAVKGGLDAAADYINPMPAVVNANNAVGDFMGRVIDAGINSPRPGPENMAKSIQGQMALSGIKQAPTGTSPAVLPQVQVSPAEIAQNNQVINSAQAAITKPQMDYATWAKNNPTMAGKGDALLDPAKREQFIQSMKGAGPAQGSPGGRALPTGITNYGDSPKEQAAANAAWKNISESNAPGGGMAIHDSTGEKILRTDVLPAPQQKAGISSEKELRAALGQRVLEGWQNGQMNLDETTKALKGLQDYDNSVIKGGLPGVQEKMELKYEADKKKAEESFVRKQEEQVVKDRHDTYKEGMKQWSEASKIEDPHEKVERQMELNREHFASLLPPEAQDLAKVPVSLDAFIYKAKMLARQKMMENPNDIRSKEYFASLNTPEGKKKAELEWKEKTAKRDSYLRPRR